MAVGNNDINILYVEIGDWTENVRRYTTSSGSTSWEEIDYYLETTKDINVYERASTKSPISDEDGNEITIESGTKILKSDIIYIENERWYYIQFGSEKVYINKRDVNLVIPDFEEGNYVTFDVYPDDPDERYRSLSDIDDDDFDIDKNYYAVMTEYYTSDAIKTTVKYYYYDFGDYEEETYAEFSQSNSDRGLVSKLICTIGGNDQSVLTYVPNDSVYMRFYDNSDTAYDIYLYIYKSGNQYYYKEFWVATDSSGLKKKTGLTDEMMNNDKSAVNQRFVRVGADLKKNANGKYVPANGDDMFGTLNMRFKSSNKKVETTPYTWTTAKVKKGINPDDITDEAKEYDIVKKLLADAGIEDETEEEETADKSKYEPGKSNGYYIATAAGEFRSTRSTVTVPGDVLDHILEVVTTDKGPATFGEAHGSIKLNQTSKFQIYIRLYEKGGKMYWDEYYGNGDPPEDCGYLGEYNSYCAVGGTKRTGYRINYLNNAFIDKPNPANGAQYVNPSSDFYTYDLTGDGTFNIGGVNITPGGGAVTILTQTNIALPVYTDKNAVGVRGVPAQVVSTHSSTITGVNMQDITGEATIAAANGANVYEYPRFDSKVLGQFAYNDKVTLLGICDNGWYRCKIWNSNNAYIYGGEDVIGKVSIPYNATIKLSCPSLVPLLTAPDDSKGWKGWEPDKPTVSDLWFGNGDIIYNVTGKVGNYYKFKYTFPGKDKEEEAYINGTYAKVIDGGPLYYNDDTYNYHGPGPQIAEGTVAIVTGVRGQYVEGVYPSMMQTLIQDMKDTGETEIPVTMARYLIPDGAIVDVISIIFARETRWALCIYNGGYCYIQAERLDLSGAIDSLPSYTINYTGDLSNNINIDYPHADVLKGVAYVAARDTYVMLPYQALTNACSKASGNAAICDNDMSARLFVAKKGSIFSVVTDEGGYNPVIERLGPNKTEYVIACVYIDKIGYNTYAYLLRDALYSYDQVYTGEIINNVAYTSHKFMHDTGLNITQIYHSGTVFTPEYSLVVISADSMGSSKGDWNDGPSGDYQKDIDDGYAVTTLTAGFSMTGVAREEIRGKWWMIIYLDGNDLFYYVTYDSVKDAMEEAARREAAEPVFTETGREVEKVQVVTREELIGGVDGTEYEIKEVGGGSVTHRGGANYKWYEVTLPAGTYPDEDTFNRNGMGIKYLPSGPDRLLPADWDGTFMLGADLSYMVARYPQKYLKYSNGGEFDARQITKINRFRYISDMEGMGTKSFIFMTRPDLNIYEAPGQMNPDLKRLPPFKYIGRNRDVGYGVISSLEYFGVYGQGETPWLSIITNQSRGYTTIDREIQYTEVGETFHGHRVLYGKHDFKHNYAGTVSIPFSDRRDLSLYYTIKLWTEYIHNINIGLVEPRELHIANSELDYAVSLYYIQTLEDMQEIVYWEKLTGVFPLKCPDSIFSWQTGETSKNLDYDIEFAYSLRSVMDPNDLYELDHLYNINAMADGKLNYPRNESFVYDINNNIYLSHMAAYFHTGYTADGSTDDNGQLLYDANKYKTDVGEVASDQYNAFVTSLMEDPAKIANYYYEPYTDIHGESTYFLANWLPKIQSPGIPYVTGPFVVPHKDYNGGKFLLKWV